MNFLEITKAKQKGLLIALTVFGIFGTTPAKADLAWSALPGAAVDIGAGGKGQVWVTNAQQDIYRWANGNWAHVPGKAVRVGVDSKGNAWVVNATGGIYQWTNNSWKQIPGALADIGIGANGSVWGVSSAQAIYRLDGNAWTRMPGAAVRIAVDPHGSPWVVNAKGGIYTWVNNNWVKRPGSALDVAVCGNGDVYVNGSNAIPYKWNGSDWEKQSGSALANIACDGEGRVFATTSAQTIGTALQGTPSQVAQTTPTATPKPTPTQSATSAPQLKPIAMPNLATPSNLQIVVEQPKAPVPIVIPVLLTEAQKAEYLRWTDALRNEFLNGYQPLTTDAQRLEFIRSKLTRYEPKAYGSQVIWSSAPPPAFTVCGKEGEICKPTSKVWVMFGAGNKYATAWGEGNFTCAAKGKVNAPSDKAPQDLGVDDPAPGAAKSCYTYIVPTPVAAVPVKQVVGTPLAQKLQCKAGDVESQNGVCEGTATCPAPNTFVTPPSTVVEEFARNTFCGRSVAAQIPCPAAPAGLHAVTWKRSLCQHAPNCGDQTFDSGRNRCISSQTTGEKALATLTNNLAGSASPSTQPGCYVGFTYNAQTKLCEKNATPSCPDGFLAIHAKTPESGYPDSCVQLAVRLVTCNDPHYVAQKGVRSAYFGGGKTTCSYALPGFGMGF